MSRAKRKAKHRMQPIHGYEFSPMARGTKTKTRREQQRRRDSWDRKGKHKI